MCIEVGCDLHLPLCGASEGHFGPNIAPYMHVRITYQPIIVYIQSLGI